MNALKNASGCVDPGPHDGPLHFHHVDPTSKAFNISDGALLSAKRLADELAKCVVLCSACHIRRHHG